ncbi:MAG: hypothetical protein ACRC6I_11240, partial [Paracoccaceae bacterium]
NSGNGCRGSLGMQDGFSTRAGRQFLQGTGGVASFASEVVARLVSGEVNMTAALREDLIARFMHAVVNADLTDFEALKPELRRARISPATFSDRYVPEIARRLGVAWEDDTMSFAEVTMGASRLQAILRQIGADWVADGSRTPESGHATVLLIVPSGEQHTLGVFVLLGQLRRRGISVCLRISPTEGDLRALFADRRFDGAMVSLATVDKFDDTCALLQLLKSLSAGQLRIAMGGAALPKLTTEPPEGSADILTNDLSLAIAALGLAVLPMRADA